MKTIKRGLALMLALGMLLALCSCGSDKSQIKQTIQKFETACQKGDAESIMDYIDPSVATPILGVSSLFGSLTGQESGQVLNSLVSFWFGLDEDGSDFLSSIRIDVEDVAVNDDSATALCDISFTAGGTDYEKDATITLIRVEDEDVQWRISGIDFN